MYTSVAFLPLAEGELPNAFARVRRHAAQVRAILVELDHLPPLSAGRPATAPYDGLHEQLAEEVGHLGRRLLECAAALADPRHIDGEVQSKVYGPSDRKEDMDHRAKAVAGPRSA